VAVECLKVMRPLERCARSLALGAVGWAAEAAPTASAAEINREEEVPGRAA